MADVKGVIVERFIADVVCLFVCSSFVLPFLVFTGHFGKELKGEEEMIK